MRELKFRVWDKAMHQYRHFVLQKGVSVSIGADLEIEQYTGLKDQNGKEIYEGDIVRIDSMDEIRVGYVELVADQYCIVCGEEDGHKIVAEFYYYSKPEENCEVIGNIHENPELLDVKEEG